MIKNIFILLLVSFNLQANLKYELLNEYRTNGIESIISKLESSFEEEEFWMSSLENIDTTYGYYEKYRLRFLFANKQDNRLYLIDKVGNNFEPIKYYDMINGIPGDKQERGDLRTPLGLYPLDRFDPKNQFYGPISFNLHYPNELDNLLFKKTGSGIWLHGYPMNNEARNPETKGCLALHNTDLMDLDEYLQGLKYGFVIISNDDQVLSITKDVYANVLSELYKWKKAWKYSDINSYLNFYSKDFRRYDGKNLEQFSVYKKRIFARNEKKVIKFKHISIIPIPNSVDKNIFKVSFFENYRTKNITFNGTKELYIEIKDEKMKILIEK